MTGEILPFRCLNCGGSLAGKKANAIYCKEKCRVDHFKSERETEQKNAAHKLLCETYGVLCHVAWKFVDEVKKRIDGKWKVVSGVWSKVKRLLRRLGWRYDDSAKQWRKAAV